MIALPDREGREGTDYIGDRRREARGPLDTVYKLCDTLGIRHGKLEYPGERRRCLEDLRGRNTDLEVRLKKLEARGEAIPAVEAPGRVEHLSNKSGEVGRTELVEVTTQRNVDQISTTLDRAQQSYVATPQEATSGIVRSAASVGAVGAAAGAGLGYFGTGTLGGAALAAAPFAWQGLLAGAGMYTGGLVHNMLWKKEGKPSPGKLGTFLRGIISPVSIPVGVVRNLTWNRKSA